MFYLPFLLNSSNAIQVILQSFTNYLLQCMWIIFVKDGSYTNDDNLFFFWDKNKRLTVICVTIINQMMVISNKY